MAAFWISRRLSASLIGLYFVVPWLAKHLLARQLTAGVRRAAAAPA